mmetsp:Transcript_22547/g.58862  ORF Transcript_22547/g.58862 Transcript_22547/m.58862 type:complete len:319 (+) Transcript_22547:969-1925(+)
MLQDVPDGAVGGQPAVQRPRRRRPPLAHRGGVGAEASEQLCGDPLLLDRGPYVLLVIDDHVVSQRSCGVVAVRAAKLGILLEVGGFRGEQPAQGVDGAGDHCVSKPRPRRILPTALAVSTVGLGAMAFRGPLTSPAPAGGTPPHGELAARFESGGYAHRGLHKDLGLGGVPLAIVRGCRHDRQLGGPPPPRLRVQVARYGIAEPGHRLDVAQWHRPPHRAGIRLAHPSEGPERTGGAVGRHHCGEMLPECIALGRGVLIALHQPEGAVDRMDLPTHERRRLGVQRPRRIRFPAGAIRGCSGRRVGRPFSTRPSRKRHL